MLMQEPQATAAESSQVPRIACPPDLDSVRLPGDRRCVGASPEGGGIRSYWRQSRPGKRVWVQKKDG